MDLEGLDRSAPSSEAEASDGDRMADSPRLRVVPRILCTPSIAFTRTEASIGYVLTMCSTDISRNRGAKNKKNISSKIE